MLKAIFFLLFVCFFISTTAQRIKVEDAIHLLGKPRSVVYNALSTHHYSYTSKDDDIETFERSRTFGPSTLNAGFKKNILTVIGWSESITYSSVLFSEIVSQGFIKNDEKSIALAFVFENTAKNLMITLINQSTNGYIVVNIGNLSIPATSTSALKGQNDEHSATPKANRKQLLEDTAKQGAIVPKSNKPKAVMPKH